MAITFATPLAQARVILNDPTGAIYQDTPMIALGNKVYKELQNKVSALGINTTKEVSTAIDVPAGTVELIDSALLPTDLISPIRLYERADGSTLASDWMEMEEKSWLPNQSQETRLNYWQWREEGIKFLGATTAREVLVYYLKSLGTISATSSSILILNSTEWLAQRLAAVAALTLGASPAKAAALDTDLTKEGGIWDDLRASLVKKKQNIPVRRRRTRYRVP
jgi:hypothetical protein